MVGTLRFAYPTKNSLPRARPVLAAAERTHAALDPERIRARHRNVARIGRAVVGVVDLARPLAGTARMHAAEQGKADHRTLLQRRIGILVVDLRLAGGRIDRLAQTDDDAANAAAAFADPYPCIAGLGGPGPARIAGALGAGGGRG